VFWFELMAGAEPRLVGIDKIQAHAQTQETHGQQKHTLLCVEDNPANLKLIEQLVARRPQLRLLSAATGALGIELARANRPEVILMDINLPDISGHEALSILRADPATAHIPVIAISANAMPHDIQKGLQAGFFRYLTKPIKVDEFINTLDKALESTRELKELSQQALKVLPAELVESLREATLAADLDRIMELLKQAEAYDPDIANELRAFASRFAYTRLLERLTPGKDAS
jgi:CheY-like chemotaxis protein